MDRIKQILESGQYEKLSSLDMKMLMYREFGKFDDDELKTKFILKMLEKEPDKKFKDYSREQYAKDILYLDLYMEYPPCFFDKKWVPTLEELDDFSDDELDYLVNDSFIDDYRCYKDVKQYESQKRRHKKICKLVEEYRRNKK